MLSEHRGIQELARDGIQSADQRGLHPAESELRERDVRPDRESASAVAARVRCAARTTKHPQSDGNLGEFLALDVTSGKILWRHRTPSPSNTAALATAGGVVFGGDWDRHMYAYDATTGKVLWQTRLPTSAQGFPDHVSGKRQAVRGDAGGDWRRELVNADCAGARAGNPPAELRQRLARLRAAKRVRAECHAASRVARFCSPR